MSRHAKTKIKTVRRLGYLPGLTHKRVKLPRPNMKKKKTRYALLLSEKQKIRYNYGLKENQLLNTFKQINTFKESAGRVLLQEIEMRLDNTVFRLGFAPTIPAARQMVGHKHLTVNNVVVSIPSYKCRAGDIIAVKADNKSVNVVKKNTQLAPAMSLPSYLQLDKKNLSGKVLKKSSRNWVALKIKEPYIVEFYSRKV